MLKLGIFPVNYLLHVILSINMNDKRGNKIQKELGDKLLKAREKNRFTQAEVATKTGMDVTYYARIERGEINTSYKKLYKIAKVLKIKLI